MFCNCTLPYFNPGCCDQCVNNPYRRYYGQGWTEPIDYKRLAEEIAEVMQDLTITVTYTTTAGESA